MTYRYALIRYRDSVGVRRVGSGYLVKENTVLTADHVASGSEHSVEFTDRTFKERDVVRTVRSFDTNVDLAVLILSGPASGIEAVPYARVNRRSMRTIEEVRTVGYPWWARGRKGNRTGQVEGFIRPSEYLYTDMQGGADGQLLTLEGDRTPPQPIPAGTLDRTPRSPWAGMSGAPVIARDMLIGVIHSDNRSDDGKSLTVTPLTALNLLADAEKRQEFCDVLGLGEIDDLADVNGDDTIGQATLPAAHPQEFCSEIREHYEKKLDKIRQKAPDRWNQQQLDQLRDKCERDANNIDATADPLTAAAMLEAVELLKTLCVAVRALPVLRQIGGREVGITRLQYLYLRHVGRWPDWPDRNNIEGMLILAASAGETERLRARSEPEYQLPDGLSALARFMLGIAGHSKDSLAATLADPGMLGMAAWVTEPPLEHQASDARTYLEKRVGRKTWVLIELDAQESVDSVAREWPTGIVVDAVPEGGDANDIKTNRFRCTATSEDQLKDALRNAVDSCLPAGETFVDLYLPRHWLDAKIEHWDVVKVGLVYRSMIWNHHRPHLRWRMQRHDDQLLDLMRRRCGSKAMSWGDPPQDISPDITSDPVKFRTWLGERDRDGTPHPPFFIGSSFGAENHDPFVGMLQDGYGFVVWFRQEPTDDVLHATVEAVDKLTAQERRDNLPSVLAATAELERHWPSIVWSNPEGREDFPLPPLRPGPARRGRR